MKAYVKLTPEGLIALNSDNATDQTNHANDSNTREFTSEEYALFGDQIKYVGNENTTVTGTSLDDATVSYTPYTDTYFYNLKMSEIREKRNKLLADTDWEIVKHTEKGETIPTALKTYRDALRDVTENIDTLSKANAVTMPTRGS